MKNTTARARNEIKLIIPKKEKEFLKEGEQLIVRNIKGDVITLIKPQKSAGIEQFRGIWENENTNEVIKGINKQWKKWKKTK